MWTQFCRQEAKAIGYDEALLTIWMVSWAWRSRSEWFFETNGEVVYASTGNILPGITRKTVIELCHDLEIPVEEEIIYNNEIKNADAVFLWELPQKLSDGNHLMELVFESHGMNH